MRTRELRAALQGTATLSRRVEELEKRVAEMEQAKRPAAKKATPNPAEK